MGIRRSEFLRLMKSEIARENARIGEPMALLLFPEGTIVTANTRGISKKLCRSPTCAP
jgi:hypothetical protein